MAKKKTNKTTSKKSRPTANNKRASGKKPSVKKNKTAKATKAKAVKAKTGKAKAVKTKALKAKVTGSLGSALRFWLLRGLIVGVFLFAAFTVYLDITIRAQFEGQKWALPAHVYTRPMELYIGQQIDRSVVQAELDELGYRAGSELAGVGSYLFTEKELLVYQRGFRFWDGVRDQQKISLKLDQDSIRDIQIEDEQGNQSSTEIVRLEPRLFGSVSPLSHEDRSLLKLEDAPQELIDALVAIEDRQFYSHFGINPVGIARALYLNIRAGRVVQGGSTLTQQLVKNYYLSTEQTYRRKLVEMMMAVLLEIHYSKDQIMQAYLNEVYLSQAGNRAIHGFELASNYFYGRPLQELELDQFAMLAGVNNGPSFYNPIRHPERALKRRNLVLKTMLDEGVIDLPQYDHAVTQDLKLRVSKGRAAALSYPSFLGFVRGNLQDDYQQSDLSSDGLQIHTTLNPRIQEILEENVRTELSAIEKRKNIEADSLQAAAVVIRTDNGEVVAMVGDRNANFSGYNRAVSAKRPVGSLLKPFVYLTALESPQEYSLASIVSDTEITVTQKGSPDWQPQNYDGQEHGQVMLIDALAKSYNMATVQLGMAVGVPNVSGTIRRIGFQDSFSQLPSVLLGAVSMSVMDISQLYLTLASGGFKTPVKGVRSVLSNANEPLARYPLQIEQVVESEYNTLINFALQEVVRSGTARSVLKDFSYDYGLAGKTGTTDDYRDSWFAGFSGNYLSVVWVGRDDNQPTGLTGASGAARIWSKIMQKIPLQPLVLPEHEELIPQTIYSSSDPQFQDCSVSRQLPIMLDSLPLENVACQALIKYDLQDEGEQQHFEKSARNERTTRKPKRKRRPFWKRIFR